MAIKNHINKFIIQSQELKRKFKSKDIRIIDCRWYLGESKRGVNEYQSCHIKEAIFFDIDKISNHSSDLPHMFPKNKMFSNFLKKNDIDKKNQIIIYDQEGFLSSARVWLTFKYFGFKNVKILDGGIKKWRLEKFPVTKLKTEREKNENNFIAIKQKIIINKKKLQELIRKKKKEFTIIDARPKDRYHGLIPEPRSGLIRGNIKPSINIPYNSIQKKNGCLKDFKDLKKLIFNDKKISKDNDIICYCGSGVTACNIFFVLKILGFRNVKLYDGSWAEWGKKNSNQN